MLHAWPSHRTLCDVEEGHVAQGKGFQAERGKRRGLQSRARRGRIDRARDDVADRAVAKPLKPRVRNQKRRRPFEDKRLCTDVCKPETSTPTPNLMTEQGNVMATTCCPREATWSLGPSLSRMSKQLGS